MPGIHDYALFVASCVLLNVMPGQDTLYILGRSIGEGRRIGVASALGVSAGSVVHTFAAALGLSAIIATSATAFLAVKLLGAAYLIYLGVRALTTRVVSGVTPRAPGSPGAAAAFRQGLVTNVLNPKVALFFLAFLPQFIDVESSSKIIPFMLLGLTFVATGTVWCIVLAVAAAGVGGLFTRYPSAHAWLHRMTGGLFLFLGVRLALSER